MIKSFLRHYFELPTDKINVVCLGGGVGTSQVLKGLRNLPFNLTAVVSMADDGGSAGRLRRAFSVPPPGDLVNCLAALSEDESTVKKLLLFRFAGERYGKDTDLGGHKLGNLIFVALAHIYKGDYGKALEEFSKIISTSGKVLPATIGDINIWAQTESGQKVYGEQNIDLGQYNRRNQLQKVYIDPPEPKAYRQTISEIKKANVIIAGPGDLFTTVLPVLIVPEIKRALKNSKSKKIFIVNIANKPFETRNFKVSDYLKTVTSHLDGNFFDTIIVNSNYSQKIPTKLKYTFVRYDKQNLKSYPATIIEGDFVSRDLSIYHDSYKIAETISNNLK